MSRHRSPASRRAEPAGDDRFMNRDDLPCRGVDPDLFFTDGHGQAAKDICTPCPAVDDCREYALARPFLAGVWGATCGKERERLRRERREAA